MSKRSVKAGYDGFFDGRHITTSGFQFGAYVY